MTEENRSVNFRRARELRSQEVIEDYTELIDDYVTLHGQVRIRDIAKVMGITHVSVLKSLKRLVRDGYIEKESDEIALTPLGKKTADEAREKHQLLIQFFLHIGIPKDVVERDVEGLEHYISPEMSQGIRRFLAKNSQK